ncbi:hypothetical protein JSQ80_26905 [Paenibacillus apiarius]|nr:hypothetical protein [Paenibacillus apiarius]
MGGMIQPTIKEKKFKSVSNGDLGIDADDSEKDSAAEDKDNQELFDAIKEILKDKVKNVKVSKRLKSHPVCLSSEGELSIEMEKILKAVPNVQADKVLEINVNHDLR